MQSRDPGSSTKPRWKCPSSWAGLWSSGQRKISSCPLAKRHELLNPNNGFQLRRNGKACSSVGIMCCKDPSLSTFDNLPHSKSIELWLLKAMDKIGSDPTSHCHLHTAGGTYQCLVKSLPEISADGLLCGWPCSRSPQCSFICLHSL